MIKSRVNKIGIALRAASTVVLLCIAACAPVDVPDARTPSIPSVAPPMDRYEGLNEKRDPVTRVKLGRDILVPQPLHQDELPNVNVGPYELRGETLASALQLILDDYDVSIAFEAPEGMTRKITAANLHGKMSDVVPRVCALADLYCHYEDGTITVKKYETFVVSLPPLTNTEQDQQQNNASTGGNNNNQDPYTLIGTGLGAVTGTQPTVDKISRIIIYTASQRTQKYAQQYFAQIRKSTALIIFETHIWEVTLNNENRTGINWNSLFNGIGASKFNIGAAVTGGAPTGTATPISISAGAGANVDTQTVLSFISERGAVKTISQPQITVLSGSKASLSVSQKENFVSGVSRTAATTVGGNDTVSATTSTVTTGLTMDVTSAWDQATVYGKLKIVLDDLLKIDEFSPDTNTKIQLPQTANRSLETEIRVRPGDAILIGGLVSEKDDLSDSGPGLMKPWLSTSRAASKKTTELVFLMRPRVVAFIPGNDDQVPIVEAPKEGQAAPKMPVMDDVAPAEALFAPAPEQKPVALKEMPADMAHFTAPPADDVPPAATAKMVSKDETASPAFVGKVKDFFSSFKVEPSKKEGGFNK